MIAVRTNRLPAFSLLAWFLLLFVCVTSSGQETPPRELSGHVSAVNAAVYTPDQRHVITVGADQTIRIWSAVTGKQLRALSGHTGPVLTVDSSPDSLVLISGAGDNSIRMWDVPRADPLQILKGHQSLVRDVAIGGDGKWVVSFSDDMTGRVWNLDDGSTTMVLKGLTAVPVAAAVRNDGNQIAGGDETGEIWVWETLEGSLDGRIAAHQGPIRGLTFHPNNQRLVSAGADGLLKVWQLPITPPRELLGHESAIYCVAITNNGQLSITGGQDSVRVHQLSNGRALRELLGATGPIHAVAVSLNNVLVAAAGPAGVIKFWNLADGADRLQISGHDHGIRALVFHPDNTRFASAGEDGTIRLWRLPKPPLPMAGHKAEVLSVVISASGAIAATASADHSVRLWNAVTGQALRTLSGHQQIVSRVVIRADSAQVASGDAAGEVRFWNQATGAAEGVLGAHEGALQGISYGPSGRQLATVGADGLLKIWKLPLPAAVTFAGNAEAVTATAITSDGKWVVTGGADKTVRIYDATTSLQARSLPGVPDAVSSVAFSGDDVLTVVGTTNGQIKIWKTADGTPWLGAQPPIEGALQAPSVLSGHDGAVVSLAFDTQAKRVVSAGADGTIRVWQLPAAPQLVSDNTGPSARFVVSHDGKLSATAGMFEGKPAVIVRDMTDGSRIVQRLLGHTAAVTSIAFQHDGSRLISGGADGTVTVWDLADSKFPQVQTVKLDAAVNAVALSDNGTQLFAASVNLIHQYLVADATEVRRISGHTAAVTTLAVAGPQLVSGSADGTVRLWVIATGAAAGQMNHAAAVLFVTVSGDRMAVASCGADKLIKIWNTTGGPAVASLTGHTGPVVAAMFNADGSRLASVGNDGLWLWDIAGKRRLESIELPQTEPRGVGFVAGRLAVGAADGTLRLVSPHLQQLIDAHQGGVTTIALSPDDSRIVSSGNDKTLQLWNLADGKKMATFAGPTDLINAIAVSSDGKQMIAGGLDSTLRVWPLPTAVTAQPLTAAEQWEFSAGILALDLADDGHRVAIAGDDRLVRIWDLKLGRELERLAGHTAAISDVTFSPDGRTVVTSSADKSVRLTTLALSHVAAMAKPDAKSMYDVAFLPDGKQVVVAGIGNALTIWSIGQKDVLTAVSQLPPAMAAEPALFAARQVNVAVRGDGAQIASLDVDGRVNVWSMPDGQLAYVLAATAVAADAATDMVPHAGQVGFSGDHTKLVVGQGVTARIHAADDGRLLQQWQQPSTVSAAAVTPNGATLVIGRIAAEDNATLLTFSLERLIDAHQGAIRSLAFTADGNGLVSGGEDKMVRLWTIANGKLRRTFGGCQDHVTSVATTRDGTRIVAGSADKTVRLWPLTQPADRQPEDVVPATSTIALPAAVHSVSVSVDNLKLAVATEDHLVRVLDLAEGHQLQRFAGHSHPVVGVAFAVDNKTLISISESSARVDSLSILRAIRASESSINDLALSNNGAQVITAAKEGVKQWNLADGNLLREFKLPRPSAVRQPAAEPPEPEAQAAVEYHSIAVSGTTQLAAVDAEKNLVIWNLGNGQVVAQNQLDAAVRRLRYSPDNQKLVAVCQDDHVRFYSPIDATLTYDLTSDTPLLGVAFTGDSRTVLTGGQQLKLWRYASPTASRTLTGHGGPVLGLTFSPSGRWIASASADQTVRIWDANTGAQVKQLNGHQGAVYSVAFSPDESLLVSCGAEKGLRVWDVLGGRQLKQISVGQSSLYSVEFLADGKRIAAGGIERKIFILDLFTGELQNSLERHSDFLYRVTLNRSGTRLLSCGYGGSIMLWNVANGELLFETNIGRVANYADLSPNGQRVVVAAGDGKAYFVDIPNNAR
jgi:WD40 repeat protein